MSWEGFVLPATVRVGADVVLEDSGTFRLYKSQRQPGLVLGDRARVYSWTMFSVGPDGLLEVGPDSVLVGPVFMCADHITVGRDVTISYGVTIADCDFHPLEAQLRRRDAMASSPAAIGARVPLETAPVTIGDGASIGIGAIILRGSQIGSGALIAPGAVVTGTVPPGATATGNPAQVVGR